MLMEFSDEEDVAIVKRRLKRRSIGSICFCPKNWRVEWAMEGLHKGEVRRVNVVYYLSFKGKIEPPHLVSVRVYHTGVRLHDVKRWLSDLRGKDMPDSFAWSYKRRYKAGFVWQDLMNGDLITPICDNEYVLKGSHLATSTYSSSVTDSLSSGEKTDAENEEPEIEVNRSQAEMPKMELDGGLPPEFELQPEKVPPIPRPRIDDPIKHPAYFKIDSSSEQHVEPKKEEISSPPERVLRARSGRQSSRVSRVVRNVFTCGMEEMNVDPPLLPIGRQERSRRSLHIFRYIRQKLRSRCRDNIVADGTDNAGRFHEK